MYVPRTPKRSTQRPSIHSPYFSPSKPRESKFYSVSYNNEDDFSSADDLDTNTTDQVHSGDPLFCYYFRSFFVAYRRLASLKPTMIQEAVAQDPWKLLIAVTLLNKTSGKLAIPVFWAMMAKWPTPWALSNAHSAELVAMLRPLGTYNIRSARLIKLSEMYLRDPPRAPDLRPSTPRVLSTNPSPHKSNTRETYPPTPVSHLPGAGQYALDSYRVFCTVNHPSSLDEWKVVVPTDKELIRYLKWKWAFVERKEWTPATGITRPASLSYLNTLISELEGASHDASLS